MKTFVTTLAIVTCVSILFPFKSANGENAGIAMISSDGSYLPVQCLLDTFDSMGMNKGLEEKQIHRSSVMAWNSIFDEVAKHTDAEGLTFLHLGQSQLEPVDKALRNGDLVGAVEIFRKCLPYLRQMIPHVNNANLQKHLTDTADRIEKFIGNIQSNGLTLLALNTFFSAESKNLGGILGALIGAVVHIVDNVGGLVGGLLGSILG